MLEVEPSGLRVDVTPVRARRNGERRRHRTTKHTAHLYRMHVGISLGECNREDAGEVDRERRLDKREPLAVSKLSRSLLRLKASDI
jgi:hypothetical protein